MTGSRLLSTLAATAAVVLTAACGDAPSAPTVTTVTDAEISADVAAVAGDAAAGAVHDLAADEALAGLTPATTAGCSYDTTIRYHVCSRVTERGLAVERRYQFRDAAGTPTESFDPVTTASVNFRRTAEGTVSATDDAGVAWTRTTHDSSNRTVSGLAGPEAQRVWNGMATSADSSTHAGPAGTRHYAATVSRLERDVVLKLPRSSYPWPQSGTVTQTTNATLTLEGAREAARVIARTTVVTFNGTAQVPITVDALSCTLNLETRAVSGCRG